MQPSISLLDMKHGAFAYELDPLFAVAAGAWHDDDLELVACDGTAYGFVLEGSPLLRTTHFAFQLQAHSFFALPLRACAAQLHGFGSRGLLMVRGGYHGVLHIGGPLEPNGRLRYIDGCTDSLLIPPQRHGEPCLNALYFPPGIAQTMHTHPSVRVGIVVDGRGLCETPQGKVPLEAGSGFVIHADGPHRFLTPYDRPMRVIAFHPDSDFGPRDEDHPMLNRTMVDGAIAAPAIRTGAQVAVEFQQ